MLNFLCLKWGNKYSVDYVNNLYSMVSRNYSHSFKFFCMTEDSSGIREEVNIIPLLDQEHFGWWHKITFFHPELENYIQGRVITLDLDLVIVDNIDCFDTREDFAIIADYIPRNGYNSSIMNFGVGTMNHIYNKFKPEYSSKYWGDQAWITLQTRTFASIYSREWVRSYKWECLNPSFHIPENCKIILYHGKPDPHETLENVGEYWC